MPIGQKRFWIVLLFLRGLIAIGGAWLAGLGIPLGWHIGGLGVAWFLSGIWIPAYHDKELMNGIRDSAQGTCVLGSLAMFAGMGLSLFGPTQPVLGSGTWGDIVTFAGFALYLGGLWAIAPGPGGIAVG